MAMGTPKVIESDNISLAWLRVLGGTLAAPGFEPLEGPTVVSVLIGPSGYPKEVPGFSELLDSALERSEKPTTYDSASTIFPLSTWLSKGRPACSEFSLYYRDRIFPRLQALHSLNKRGTYFERMINFRGIDSKGEKNTKNQLLQIINAWNREDKKGKRVALRRSALQASIFDPSKDHTGNPRQSFPCLQQVSFSYEKDALCVNGYYPAQYVFERGYGNYLGLCHLGYFMATQLALRLVRMNCFIGHFPQSTVSQSVVKGTLNEATSLIRSFEKQKSNV
jgi:hypothetical protein